MDRRKLLQLGTAAASVAGFAGKAFAQGAGNVPKPVAGAPKLVIDAYSRSLQWLRTPQTLAQGVIDLGLKNIDLTVAPAPGHVDPANAKTDLPNYVNGLKQQGIAVRTITISATDTDPNLEAILATASGLGIQYYVWSGLKYDESQPYQAQLDALKPRMQKLAKLNEKYKIRGLYHPQAGAGNIGSSFFDILDVLKGFDPKFVGVQYDTGTLLQPMKDVFVSHMRLGGAYIGAMALNDATVTLDFPQYEFGPFEHYGAQADANAGPAGDNTGNDNGNPTAFGGGGRPLPYHLHPMRVGTGMIDLILIARTLKAMNFSGPLETQIAWALGGVETGADRITLPRQSVLGQLKRDRLTVEHGFFAGGWDADITLPAFQVGGAPAAGRGGRGGAAGGAGGRGGAGGGAAPDAQ